MSVLRYSINNLMRVDLDMDALERLQWKDFGNGLSMARLARQGSRELVFYRVRADAATDAFLKHEHIGGEFFFIVRGKIIDENGEDEEGDNVFFDSKSIHKPPAVGGTPVLVPWPAD